MKIGPIDIKRTQAAVAAERKSSTAAVSGTEASAKVELSPHAALSAETGRADFDAQKVERIAQAIRDGRFEVNAEAIADKLIANARELLPSAKN